MSDDDAQDLAVMPYFPTDGHALNKIKELIDYSAISIQQKWFIHLIYELKFTRKQVSAEWLKVFNCHICKDSMNTCVRRTAFSLWWRKGTLAYGTNDYLTKIDMETLKMEIRERAELHNALDTVSILDFAQKLKIERYNKAIEFLRLMRSEKTAEMLENEPISKPTRTWTNNLVV